jgi:hypothetical protein
MVKIKIDRHITSCRRELWQDYIFLPLPVIIFMGEP